MVAQAQWITGFPSFSQTLPDQVPQFPVAGPYTWLPNTLFVTCMLLTQYTMYAPPR